MPGQFISAAARRLFTWRPGGYLRASTNLFGWLLLRAFAQAVMVLLLARLLGAAGYGQFVSILAIASFFSPLAGLGLQGILLRDVARKPEKLPELLGAALGLWWRSTLIFGLAAIAVIVWALPGGIPLSAIVVFAFAEVASGSFVDIVGRVEQALHHANRFGATSAGLVIVRLVTLAGFGLLFKPDLGGWIWTYAAASLLYVFFLFVWSISTHRPHRTSRPHWNLALEGVPFAVGALSLRLQAEFNKPVLAQLGYEQAGNYSAAQRVVDMASLPLMAMQEAFWSRFYASAAPRGRTILTGAAMLVFALLGGGLLTLIAPLLPTFLGAGFENTAAVLVWLAWLPTLQVIRNLFNVYIVATNRAHVLTWVYIAGGTVSVILTAFLVKTHGIAGAVAAAYLTEVAIIAAQVIFRKIGVGIWDLRTGN